MRLTLLCILSLTLLILPVAPAQSAEDGGDVFVIAYQDAMAGEKAEEGGNLKVALSKFREAAKQLEICSRSFPTWSPQIVEYRKKRTAEAIVRVQEKMGHGGLDTSPGGLPTPEPQLPRDGMNGGDGLTFVDPPPIESAPPISPRALRSHQGKPTPAQQTDQNPLGQIADRIEQLEKDLKKAQNEVASLTSENASTAQKLEQAMKDKVLAEKKQEVLKKRADNAEEDLIRRRIPERPAQKRLR